MDKVLIAEQFSSYPMGRNDDDGPDNGTKFFNNYLLKNLTDKKEVVVVFDGVRAFGSSFLDQAFHVMPELLGFDKKYFSTLVKIEATGRAYLFYKKMAENFIDSISV
jgi:STAS-like domain of unknown function (DUF4325)